MRNLIRALAICLLPLAPPALAANPFAPALTVNDSVITHYDIEQRIKLLDALGANGDLEQGSRPSSSPRIASRSRPPGSSRSSFPRVPSTPGSRNSPPAAASRPRTSTGC